MGKDRLNALLQETLNVGVQTKARAVSDLGHVVVNTTVQETAVMVPTDAKLADHACTHRVKTSKVLWHHLAPKLCAR
jgi:transposase, IS5 family